MSEDFANFIKECRGSFSTATGSLPDDNSASRYALAYQLALLNKDASLLLAENGIEKEDLKNGNE
jgi:hypothetical protein